MSYYLLFYLFFRGNIFLPVQDKTLCNVQDKIMDGGSYVYINEDHQKGGIGLFTASGLDEKGNPYFFQTRTAEGVGGGVNKFEKVTAITWRLEKERFNPFLNKSDLKIYVKNSVVNLPQIENRVNPIQVRQQVEIGFANKHCLIEKREEKILCLNKFVFDFFVKRWGGKPLDRERGAIVFVDKAQGNLAHISIYSKPQKENIKEKQTNLDIATSCGEGLQDNIYFDKEFCYTISWEQFLNSLKAIASTKLKKPVLQITETDMEDLFGKHFRKPEEWYLTVISIQHELHDPYKDKNVFIGGNVKEMKLIRK